MIANILMVKTVCGMGTRGGDIANIFAGEEREGGREGGGG